MRRALPLLLLAVALAAPTDAREARHLDGGQLTPNLLGNPSIEEGAEGIPAGWTFQGNGSGTWEEGDAREGRRSLRIDGTGSWRSDPFPLSAGVVTILEATTKLRGSGRWGAAVRVDFLGAGGGRIGKVDPFRRDEHGWTRQRSEGVAPKGTVAGVLVCYTYQDAGLTAWFDALEVRQWVPAPHPAPEAVAGPLWRFDFGTPTSVVQPGYERVDPSTRYRAETGFGWVSKVRLEGRDQTGGAYRPAKTDERGEPEDRDATFLDARTRDGVAGVGSARLRIDVPPGRYRIFVLAGHGQAEASPPYFDLTVTAGKQRVGRLHKHFPGVGFDWGTFTGEAGDRGLSLGFAADRFGGAWSLAALLVYPEEEPGAGEAAAADLLRSVEALPPDLLAARTRLPSPWSERRTEPGPPGSGSPRILQGIWPLPGHPADHLVAGASPGLSADLRFSVASDVPLEGLVLARDPFRSDSGDGIPEEAVDLRHVRDRFLRYNEGYIVHDLYTVQPDALTVRLPGSLGAGEAVPFWMRVHIPPETPPGDYRSVLRVTAAEGREAHAALRIRVLPFTTEEPSLFQNVYLHGTSGQPDVPPTVGVEEAAAELRRAAVADVADHIGNPTVLVYRLPVFRRARGGFDVELAFLREAVEDHRRAGAPARDALVLLQPVLNQLGREMVPEQASLFGKHMSGAPDLPDAYWEMFGDLVERIDAALRAAGVERRVYNPWDEAFGDDLTMFIRAAAVLQERLDEPRIFCDVPTTTYYGRPPVGPERALAPHCNTWWVYGTLTDEERARELARGTWLLGRFEPEGPARARAAAGLLRWRRQEMGGNWWAYDVMKGSANTQLDGPSWGDRCLTYPTVPPSPRLAWEWTRVGHEDLRYLATLESWVAEGAPEDSRAGRRAVRRGERLLEELREAVDPTSSDPFEDPEAYEQARERVLDALLALHEARSAR